MSLSRPMHYITVYIYIYIDIGDPVHIHAREMRNRVEWKEFRGSEQILRTIVLNATSIAFFEFVSHKTASEWLF